MLPRAAHIQDERSISRRAFLAGGVAFGTTALLYGCGGTAKDDVARLVPGLAGVSGSVKDISLNAVVSEVEIASGKRITAWTYDGKLPGTEIRAKEGERLRITLKNSLPESTTIHWHGISQRGSSNMDGVPNVTQPPIDPGASMTYDFITDRPGTYFYHPHSGLQIERGLAAALIVEPKKEELSYDREYTLVVDDWLAGSPDVAFQQLQNGVFPADGLSPDQASSGEDDIGMMGGGEMGEGDEACCSNTEVSYAEYLLNGRTRDAAPEFQVKRGERVRFRLVNAGGATVFRVAIENHKLTVTHSDGFGLRPVVVDALDVAPGERYDVLVTADHPGAWPIVAAPMGHPERAARGVLRYADAAATSNPSLDVLPNELRGDGLDIRDLSSLESLQLPQVSDRPDRTIDLVLSRGGEHGYQWLINGRKGLDEPFEIVNGERVRMRMSNMTMMWHPMHLHGHSFRVLNGAQTNAPVKDTVLVRPTMHGRAEVEFLADNPGNWLIHCHHAYHLAAGMERLLKYV